MNCSSQRLCLFTIVVCAVTIYIYPLLLRMPLTDPDEGIHATIAQEMVERGDYIVPHFDGHVFRDKPFLYSAAQALSLRVFGMSEGAARLPGFLFALLGTATAVWLAYRMFDSEVALYTALASLTLVLPMILTQSPAHDIALVPWTNLIVLAFWEQEHATSTAKRWGWVAAMALSIGLAFLTKGLIGVAVVGVGLAVFSLVSRSITISLVLRMSVALLVGALIASPWYLAMEHASPGYLYYYFVDRHVLGYLTEGQEHGESSWYYYFAPVIGGAMPWLMFATAAVIQLKYDTLKSRNRATILLACWFVAGFLFLTAAGSRLLTYSLPLFPPVAILAGLGYRRFFHADLASVPRWLFVNSFRAAALFGVLCPVVGLIVIGKFLDAPSPPAAYAVAILASIAMAIGYILFERKNYRAALGIGMLWFPLIFVCAMTWPVQTLSELHSERSLAAMLNAADPFPTSIVLVGQRVGSLLFYLTPEKRRACEAAGIREAYVEELSSLVPLPSGTLLAITRKELSRGTWKEAIRGEKTQVVGPFSIVYGEPDVHVARQPKTANQ